MLDRNGRQHLRSILLFSREVYAWTALRGPQVMIIPGRHRALAHEAWSESAVRTAIDEIVTDAIAHFHPDTFWPAHPSDDGVGDGNASFYYGAAGVYLGAGLFASHRCEPCR